jgi:tRNA-uridine 2-sulfurtransferase
MKRKVAVAMSGGVDSSVTAALLKTSGHEVIGLTMRLWGEECDSEPSVSSAREVCKVIGIEHLVLDLRGDFRREIIEYFINEYMAGRTPNPCVRCNEYIKFGMLTKIVDLVRAERLATGHYSRILLDKMGRYNLLKALDENKDQSYFLYRLTQQQLSLAHFPLGDMTKDEVRDIAASMGLPSAHRKESQEVCFIPDDDYRGFIEKERPDAASEGDFVDRDGNILGRHRGVAFYTIGQRKGLGVSSPLGRRYVVERNVGKNQVVLGGEDDLKLDSFVVEHINWVPMDGLDEPREMEVRVRYRQKPVKATVVPHGERSAHVRFNEPEAGVTPGQSAVFYEGDAVIGGGIIWG